MSGSDIGSYLLGASIAKSGAETRARLEKEALLRKHDEEMANANRRYDNINEFAFETAMIAVGRGKIRDALLREAEAVIAAAKKGPLTEAQVRFLMPTAHDAQRQWDLAIEGYREEATARMSETPSRKEMILAILRRLEERRPKPEGTGK
jgi:hypothetical protein